jgi:hypothetical protein
LATVRQQAPVLEGEVEQRRQHHGREFDRDAIDPVEGLVARQAIEHGDGAFPHLRFQISDV